jgi:tetratricopeptide (TPR) repeat protein
MNWQLRVLVTLVSSFTWMAASGCLAQSTTAARLAGEIQNAELMVQQPSSQNDGTAWWKLGMLYQNAARYRDAERCYAHATSLLRHGDSRTLADALDSMGTMYVETGDYAKAAPLENQALAMREAGNDSIGVGRSWMHLAMLSLGEKDASSAARYTQMAVQRLVHREAQDGSAGTPEEQMTALIGLALARCAQGTFQGAIDPLKRAHRLALEDKDAGDFPAGYTDFLLGYAEWRESDNRQAAQLMKKGTAGIEAELGWGHPTYISVMTQYETFLEQAGQFTEAAAVRTRLAQIQVPERSGQQAASTAKAPIPASR